MKEDFEEEVYREIGSLGEKSLSFIKASKAEVIGKSKITVEEDSHEGVKVILKKDANDSIKEIKFVCSCGQTKSIILDYSE